MQRTGATPMEVARIAFPDANITTQRVSISKWINKPLHSIRLDQLKALSDFFNTTNIDNLIEDENL